ncbi:transmembrane 220 family protein [Antarcticibacterium sp. 1MA-6-2]|uniref:transmembrane 220 family protein n=1 Tax=Antarcticibacterium sp. 1MA-6-2 TaxID=2908210 RepID=UPI001F18269F|nr:transmembrane 220 family protein [Antarcticibacterium sp. 1MA-6-2]UJH90692.1 transmembrane 220 family protein [Antarcticibacterium sp. 1MA-6-2]
MKVSRIFFAIWSLLFLLFAYWQWNDPDPEVWVSIYFFSALMCVLAAFERFYLPLLIVVAIAAFFGGIYLFPSSVRDWVLQEWQQADLSMKTPDMEVARESFGLFIVSLIIGLAALNGWFIKRSKNLARLKS